MLYRQPQNGPFEIDRAGNGAQLVVAALPGLSLRNLSNNVVGTIGGTAPSGNFVGNGPFGRDLMIHPSGGTNGVGGLRFDRDTLSSNDWTLIWCGRPQNYSTSNGALMVRGADGSGSGWNLFLTYEGGPISGNGTGNLVAKCVDGSPAAFSATISGLAMVNDQHERVALVKRGSTIKVFNWRTHQMVSASAGNGVLRTSTVGIGLGFATTGANDTSGHNKVNTALAYSFGMPDSEVWATLDNPWEDFEPDGTVLRATGGASPDVTVAVTGQAATVSAGTLRASTSKALTGQAATAARGTLTATVSKALTGQAGTVSAGTLAPATSKALAGQSSTAAQGSVSTSASAGATLSGQAVTASQGTARASITVALTGQQVTAQRGSVGTSGNKSVALTGNAMAASAGTMVGQVSASAPAGLYAATVMRASPISRSTTALLASIAAQAGTMGSPLIGATVMRAAATNKVGAMRSDAINRTVEFI